MRSTQVYLPLLAGDGRVEIHNYFYFKTHPEGEKGSKKTCWSSHASVLVRLLCRALDARLGSYLGLRMFDRHFIV